MKFVMLYTKNNQSYFADVDAGVETEEPLGKYSRPYAVGEMRFRFFKKGLQFDWHTAPQPQYIIYLEGEVEVETSSGEKRTFKAGDVLLAADTTGKGHITRTVTEGQSIIVTAKEFEKLMKMVEEQQACFKCAM